MSPKDDTLQHGLILIQIDGLSYECFLQALKEKRLPFLKKLSTVNKYKHLRMFSGLPSTTPAVQAELFYGVKNAVPAFSFYDRKRNISGKMFEPDFASIIQSELEQNSYNLLQAGSSYSNIYSGGACKHNFCPGAFNLKEELTNLNWLKNLFRALISPISFIRVLSLIVIETILSFIDLARGLISRKNLFKELTFIPSRITVCVLLKELVTIFVKRDVREGLPIISCNFLGYDEQAHRRGPNSKFALWSLKGIDLSIKKIYKTAAKSKKRYYSIWIYSDHGQETTKSFHSINGINLHDAVFFILDFSKKNSRQDPDGIQRKRARWFKLINVKTTDTINKEDIKIFSLGPVAHIYGNHTLTNELKNRLARSLVENYNVPLAVVRREDGSCEAYRPGEQFTLVNDSTFIKNTHPFCHDLKSEIVNYCKNSKSGDIVLFGSDTNSSPITFATENGAHAGIGQLETSAFLYMPNKFSSKFKLKGATPRPMDLREQVFDYLNIK